MVLRLRRAQAVQGQIWLLLAINPTGGLLFYLVLLVWHSPEGDIDFRAAAENSMDEFESFLNARREEIELAITNDIEFGYDNSHGI